MPRHQRHERLRVWRSAMEMAKAVYRFTGALPESERFGLTQQLRRFASQFPATSPRVCHVVQIAISGLVGYLIRCNF